MNKIVGITDSAFQQNTILLLDGSLVILQLQYKDQQLGWFANITYGTFQLNGMRIVTSPNLLHQFKNQIPFGIACYTQNDAEPTLIGDFLSERSILYIMTATEVQTFSNFLSGLS